MEVMAPVDDPRVETERLLAVVVEGVPEGEESVQAEGSLTFGVRAVQIDVAPGPFDLLALFF